MGGVFNPNRIFETIEMIEKYRLDIRLSLIHI